MLIPPRSNVSKILRTKHKYLDQDVGREPLPDDRAQSKISKPLEQLDESAPWSSWSEITAAGSNVMKVPRSPGSINQKAHKSQITTFDRIMSDYYPDELYYPALQPLQEPQYVFSQDRSISPPMSSPLVPAQAPSPPPTTDHQSGQYPIVQQAHHQGDSMRNAVFINVEGYVNYNFGRESHRAPSPSDRREASSPKPEQDFWTGRRQSHRPSSVQSYGSSRNSSLHGSPVMDPSYQSPVFSTEDQRNGSPGAGNSPRGLFPAPIDWTATQSRDQVSQGFTFNCEICGELVKASRRFDWQ